MISFYRLSSRVLKQIKESEGAINYAVKGNLPKKHFWTLSIWRDNNFLRHFIMEEPHATAVRKFTEWSGEGSAFVVVHHYYLCKGRRTASSAGLAKREGGEKGWKQTKKRNLTTHLHFG
jgi:hypothetical protein